MLAGAETNLDWVYLPKPTQAESRVVDYEYSKPFTCQSLTLTSRQAEGPSDADLLVSDDGKNFRPLIKLPLPNEGYSISPHNTTAAFPPVTGRYFRVVVKSGGQSERVQFKLQLHSGARIDRFEIKSGDVARPSANVRSELVAAAGSVINPAGMINLTTNLDANGKLNWSVPAGNWTVLRVGYAPTGKKNAQGTSAGLGLECDKMNPLAVSNHINSGLMKLVDDASVSVGKSFTFAHMDSWEALCANWTPAFRHEFLKRRGYDPLLYLPIMAGRVVVSTEVSERFLWDVRRTIADLIAENHFAVIKEELNKRGLQFQSEAVGPNATTFVVADAFQCKAHTDFPMGEFWAGRETCPDCKEAASSAHLYGKTIVPAEAFTAVNGDWSDYPYSLKACGDRAFCRGINRFVFHRFVHNPWPDRAPGMTMGQYGINFEPSVTWWNYASPWINYISRCEWLLQQGRFVGDALYYVGESVSCRLESRADTKPLPPAGYDYDGCGTEDLLNLVSVRDGNLVTPSGMVYRILMLPENTNMSVRVARKIKSLVQAGAIVVGPKPVASPSLQDYPACDDEVSRIAAEVWGECDGVSRTEHPFGLGKVVSGKPIGDVLRELSVSPDFEFPAGANANLDYIHRRDGDTEIYFVSNQTNHTTEVRCTFRVLGKQPELWNAATGEMRPAKHFWTQDGRTVVPLHLDPRGSVFVIFRKPLTGWAMGNGKNWDDYKSVAELNDGWRVNFDTRWGGPAEVEFDKLVSWPERSENGIKYYSGTAVYKKEFIAPTNRGSLFLDLGRVEVIAEVILNGRSLGVTWKPPYRVEITPAILSGTNQLEVRVANLWPNRLIGDEQLPEDCKWGKFGSFGAPLMELPDWQQQGKPSPTGRLTFATWKHYSKDSPLLKSGLLGPVTLQVIDSSVKTKP